MVKLLKISVEYWFVLAISVIDATLVLLRHKFYCWCPSWHKLVIRPGNWMYGWVSKYVSFVSGKNLQW